MLPCMSLQTSFERYKFTAYWHRGSSTWTVMHLRRLICSPTNEYIIIAFISTVIQEMSADINAKELPRFSILLRPERYIALVFICVSMCYLHLTVPQR
jgi:hypothetical protein